MQVSLISPYHGGSHESWALGWQRYSRHDIAALTMPARFWKWRMHGGALTLARRFLEAGAVADVIVATDMLDLSTFLALTRRRTAAIPVVLYMHENQLTYPLPDDPQTGPMRRQRGERDHHYAFINVASMLAADRVVFNSAFHRNAVLDELPRFLRRFPEHNEVEGIDDIASKCSVLPVGIDCAALGADPDTTSNGAAPLVLWNQRWEYDKNPAGFFAALRQIAETGGDFRLAVCGQAFHRKPGEMEAALDALAPHLVHRGYAAPADYRRLLHEATLTASTAVHEFFGISVLEAMACRTFAILPERLSYPEILATGDLPAVTRRRCTYGTHTELVEKMRWALDHPAAAGTMAAEQAALARSYDWPIVVPRYDDLLEACR